LQECSFAPAINRRKAPRANKQGLKAQMSRRGTKIEDEDNYDGSQEQEGNSNEDEQSEEEIRDIDTFVADQNRFLQ